MPFSCRASPPKRIRTALTPSHWCRHNPLALDEKAHAIGNSRTVIAQFRRSGRTPAGILANAVDAPHRVQKEAENPPPGEQPATEPLRDRTAYGAEAGAGEPLP